MQQLKAPRRGPAHRGAALAILALALSACTSVDTTEHCVLTRYGKVIEPKMSTGMNFTPLSNPTCFTMTERNYPGGDGKEIIEAQTQDPITVRGDVAVVYRFDPATIATVFNEKRTPEAAEAEIINAIREGYRNALSQWTISEVFANRADLSDSVRRHIQRKIGNRAQIVNVFVRDIKAPEAIEAARVQAAKQAQVLDQALKQFTIDSVNTRARVMTAQADAESKRLEAAAYSQNRELLQLRIAEAQSRGLAEACKGVQTCVIGGSVMDTWRRQ